MLTTHTIDTMIYVIQTEVNMLYYVHCSDLSADERFSNMHLMPDLIEIIKLLEKYKKEVK